ncbi:ASCH domain-containing protein [Virgibacillus halophilus]|uniref:ASCH domain-containing protein n=1 Tax=Tigheibacillus halophilus TaxID=361280 RepID=UPI0036350AB4
MKIERKCSDLSSLPEKTCTIEKLVTIPKDVEKVIAGKKTATRRNGIYADIGEIMELDGKKFKVDAIYPQYLGDVTEIDARREGYDDLESYKQSILSMHPGMRWAPKMQVWVHEYSPIN